MKEAGLSRVVLQADPLVICWGGGEGSERFMRGRFWSGCSCLPFMGKSSPYVSMHYWTDISSFVAAFTTFFCRNQKLIKFPLCDFLSYINGI
jgi:hypothetical protein